MRAISRFPHSPSCVAVLAAPLVFGCAPHSDKSVAIALPELHAKQALSVNSRSFDSQRRMSRLFSNYGSNIEPDVRWTCLPNAKSYVILVEDPDAASAKPFVHWISYNIPPGQTASFQSVGGEQRDSNADGIQGKNDSGSVGYFGPHPPIGDEPHHYHFEVFALDSTLALPGGADRGTLVAAMKGHVLGSGEVVGTYQER